MLISESGRPCSWVMLESRWRRAPASRVVGGLLVRVLAVGEVGDLLEREREQLGEALAAVEPAGDRRLVGRGRRERLGGELAAGVGRDLAVRLQLVEHEAVLVGARHRHDVGEVLGRAAQHRGPADVDHLDGLLLGRAEGRGDVGERVEVDADEVERLDPVLGERRQVLLVVAAGEDPGVDARVERLDAPAEHLRRLGQRLDVAHLQAELLEEGRRAAARDQLDAELVEAERERVEAGLVVDGDQRALDHEATSSPTTRGSSRCSTSCTRARSVSTVSSA